MTDSRGYAHTTDGESLFDAVSRAIHWWEIDCISLGTARKMDDDEIMTVHLVGGDEYRVCVRRVREWLAQRPTSVTHADNSV